MSRSAGRPRPGGRVAGGGWIGGKRAVLEAIRSGRALEVIVERSSRRSDGVASRAQGLRDVLGEGERSGVPIREGSRDDLDRLVSGHRGVAARIRDAPLLTERALGDRSYGPEDVVVVLDGVVDPQNLGAAARAAEAAGAAVLVTRERRSAPPTSSAVRASAGALLHLPHARVANLPRALERLQRAGFTVVGLTGEAQASIFDEPCPPGRVAVVIGSEGRGLSRLVREACDLLVRLPMHGAVESLNASAALAAALWGYVLPRGAAGEPSRPLN